MLKYFLAIVLQENLIEGEIWPAYILCKTKGRATTRSGIMVKNMTNTSQMSLTPLYVKNPEEHPELVEFLSHFRTRDHRHDSKYDHELTKKYYPHGALFWFECTATNRQTGNCIYVKRVPDKSSSRQTDQGLAVLNEFIDREVNFKELFMDEGGMDMINVHKEICQKPGKSVYQTKDHISYKKRKAAYEEAVRKYGEENVKRSDFVGPNVWQQCTGRDYNDLIRYKAAKARSDAKAQKLLETWKQAEDQMG